MSIRTEVANGVAYTFNPDPTPPAANQLRAILRSRMLDEFTGLPMTSRLSVNTPRQGLRTRVEDGGIAGVVGHPGHLFPALDGNAVDLEMTVSASRYLPRRLAATLGPIAGFPNVFAPINFGDVAMHRAATRLRGRVVQVNGPNRVPLGAADVRILGIWPSFPPADVDPQAVMQAPNLVSLSAGLYAERDPAVDQVRRRVLGFVLGEEKTLMQRANAGQSQIRISDRINLNPGDLLAIQPNHAELAEYIVITATDGASTDDQPATITLNYPLQHNHPEGISVVRTALQAQAADNAITRFGIPGDHSIFCAALNGFLNGSVVEIIGSGDPEYHAIALYQTITDAAGYFRLPPLARVAQLQLETDRADLVGPQTLNFSPDYDLAEQRLDIVVP